METTANTSTNTARMIIVLAVFLIVLFSISTVSNVMFFADMTAGHKHSVLAIASEFIAALFTMWVSLSVLFLITSKQYFGLLIILISLASFMLIDRVILTIAYIG